MPASPSREIAELSNCVDNSHSMIRKTLLLFLECDRVLHPMQIVIDMKTSKQTLLSFLPFDLSFQFSALLLSLLSRKETESGSSLKNVTLGCLCGTAQRECSFWDILPTLGK